MPRGSARTSVARRRAELHVMPQLVRDHVRLREVARRAEAAAQLAEELRGRCTRLVRRTVERPDRGARGAASRPRRVGEQHQPRRVVRALALLELRFPEVLDVVQHERHEVHESRVRVRRGVRRLTDGRRRLRQILQDAPRIEPATTTAKLPAQQRQHDHQDQPADTAAGHAHRQPDAAPRTPASVLIVKIPATPPRQTDLHTVISIATSIANSTTGIPQSYCETATSATRQSAVGAVQLGSRRRASPW